MNIVNPAVGRRQAKPDALVRLFCFCHAGGNELMFSGWQDALPDYADVVPVRLPGRGGRVSEPLLASLLQLADNLADELVDELDRPFALFGHSMGALLAFETVRSLRSRYGVLPRLLAASGSAAPCLHPCTPVTYDLPDEEFRAELRRLNGTSEDVLNDAETMQILLPILRADFRMVDTYTYVPGAPLRCPIIALGGRADDVSPEQLDAWRRHTVDRFAVRLLDGDHFFVNHSRDELLDLLNTELRKVCW